MFLDLEDPTVSAAASPGKGTSQSLNLVCVCSPCAGHRTVSGDSLEDSLNVTRYHLDTKLGDLMRQ